MATGKIPNPMERRHQLEKSMDAKQALAIADAYVEQDRAVDALAFLAKAKSEAGDRFEEVAERAIEAGDAFLLKSVLEVQGTEHADPERWNRLAEAAEAAGKGLYATLARRLAEPAQQH